MLRTKLSKFGMASAGVAVGAILAISPVFAQGTTSTTQGSSDTLLKEILDAVKNAGITLTAEQTADLAEVVADITAVDEDEDEDEDDTAEVAVASTTKQGTKKTVTITFTGPKSSEESKGDD